MTDSIDDITVGTGSLAKLFGVTPQRLGQLVHAGVIRKHGRGRFHLAEAVSGYVSFLRDRPSGAGGTLDYREMRSRLVKLQGDMLEAELPKVRSTMVSIDDVATVLGEQCSTVRNRMLGLANRATPKVVGQDAKTTHGVIYAATVEILRELSCDAEFAAKAADKKDDEEPAK